MMQREKNMNFLKFSMKSRNRVTQPMIILVLLSILCIKKGFPKTFLHFRYLRDGEAISQGALVSQRHVIDSHGYKNFAKYPKDPNRFSRSFAYKSQTLGLKLI